jgi:hypothetical protein
MAGSMIEQRVNVEFVLSAQTSRTQILTTFSIDRRGSLRALEIERTGIGHAAKSNF